MQLVKSDYVNVHFVLNNQYFFPVFFICLTLGQDMYHAAGRIRICNIIILKIHPMGMASEMSLSYHFKDSVICPIFTSFCIHFFFYIYI